MGKKTEKKTYWESVQSKVKFTRIDIALYNASSLKRSDILFLVTRFMRQTSYTDLLLRFSCSKYSFDFVLDSVFSPKCAESVMTGYAIKASLQLATTLTLWKAYKRSNWSVEACLTRLRFETFFQINTKTA